MDDGDENNDDDYGHDVIAMADDDEEEEEEERAAIRAAVVAAGSQNGRRRRRDEDNNEEDREDDGRIISRRTAASHMAASVCRRLRIDNDDGNGGGYGQRHVTRELDLRGATFLEYPDLLQAFVACLSRNSTVRKIDLSYRFVKDPKSLVRAFAAETERKTRTPTATAGGGRQHPHQQDGIDNKNGSLSIFASHPSIREIVLSRNNNLISDTDDTTLFRILVEALATNQRLDKLSLYGSDIRDAGARIVAKDLLERNKSSSILELDLYRNEITDVGCFALANALRTNTTLVRLDLRWNRISSVGVDALERTLRNSSCVLEEVCLGENNVDVTVQQQRRIARMCKANRRILSKYQKWQRVLLLSNMKSNDDDDIDTDTGTTNCCTADVGADADVAVPLSLWPRALACFSSKPTLLFESLKATPDLYLKGSGGRRTNICRCCASKKRKTPHPCCLAEEEAN